MNHQRTENRVLLVSSDWSVRDSLADALQLAGFDVLPAENGRKAVQALAANSINVILLDFQTPFDGSDFVSTRSSTLEALTDIDPFLPLVLTCEPEAELDHATSLMADMVLIHPVELSALLEAIDMLLVETLKERVHRKSADIAIYR